MCQGLIYSTLPETLKIPPTAVEMSHLRLSRRIRNMTVGAPAVVWHLTMAETLSVTLEPLEKANTKTEEKETRWDIIQD